VGIGDTPQEAARAALRSLGEPYAREMAAADRLTVAACTQVARPPATISLTPVSVIHPERTRDSAP
jgi:hypothetical protein